MSWVETICTEDIPASFTSFTISSLTLSEVIFFILFTVLCLKRLQILHALSWMDLFVCPAKSPSANVPAGVDCIL